MNRRDFGVLALTGAAALACGCKGNKENCKPASATASAASMGLMNSKCPLMPEHAADKTVTADYKGGKVGFCCKGCVGKWSAMSDAQKDAALAKAK